jgi:AbrB family looped-hinge helix DNA binding protein
VIYLDTSVALAHLLAEDRRPHAALWRETPISFMKTRVSSKGRIVLPAEIRRQDSIAPGQEFEIERLERGQYLLVRSPGRTRAGVVDWLMSCPQKGHFVPIESESTDTL